ncbi:MAG TPA: hypothetical protein VGJ54_13255, partial [Streptosporangiaceae bacterium]
MGFYLAEKEGSFMNRPRRYGWTVLAAALALSVLASGCGSTPDHAQAAGSSRAGAPASLNVELDWVPNPDHVGLYYAQNKGYFAR